MKVREILEELDEFEKMLGEYKKNYFRMPESNGGFSLEKRAHVSLQEKLRVQLLRKYSFLRPIIEEYSQCFISTRTFEDSTYPDETYKFVIQNRSIKDFKRLYDDLEWIRGSLDRYDPETELDEHGNVIKEKEVSSKTDVFPTSDVKTVTNVYVEGNLIQGDVNLSVNHLYQTLERIIDEQIDDPKKKEETKGLLKKVYDEVKHVGTDVISKTLGEILKRS